MNLSLESGNYKLTVSFKDHNHLYTYKGRIIENGSKPKIIPVKFAIVQGARHHYYYDKYDDEASDYCEPDDVTHPSAPEMLYDFGAHNEDDAYILINEEIFNLERLTQIIKLVESNKKGTPMLNPLPRKELARKGILEHITQSIKDL